MVCDKPRNVLPFILLALGIGSLSGFYFQANGLVILGTEKSLNLVGGIASGIMIAVLGYRAYRYKSNIFSSLYLLAFIPFCTPAFGSAIAFAIQLIGAVIFLLFGQPIIVGSEHPQPTNMRTAGGDIVYNLGGDRYSFNWNGQTKSVMATSEMDTFEDADGNKFVNRGNTLIPQQ